VTGGAAAELSLLDLAPLIAAQRRRLTFRHVLALGLAGVGIVLALGFLIEGLGLARRDAVLRHVARPALVAIGALIYVPSTMVVTVIWARFDRRKALRRYPLVFLLSLIPLAAALAEAAIHALGVAQFFSSGHSSGGGSAGIAGPARRSRSRARPRRNLAAAILSKDEVASLVAKPMLEPEAADSIVAANASVGRCAGEDGSPGVTLAVYPRDRVSAWARRRLQQHASPYLEERRRRVGALAWNEEWLVVLSAVRPERDGAFEETLTSLAERVLGRLPIPD
jgi:hypothetical protein